MVGTVAQVRESEHGSYWRRAGKANQGTGRVHTVREHKSLTPAGVRLFTVVELRAENQLQGAEVTRVMRGLNDPECPFVGAYLFPAFSTTPLSLNLFYESAESFPRLRPNTSEH